MHGAWSTLVVEALFWGAEEHGGLGRGVPWLGGESKDFREC